LPMMTFNTTRREFLQGAAAVLSGTVLDGGVDWQQVRPDGVLEIDAHYTLLTEANEAIEVISQHTPNRKTLTGSKGMSEGGVMGATGVLPSAVNDALAPFGVVAERQPLSPIYIRSLLRGRTDQSFVFSAPE